MEQTENLSSPSATVQSCSATTTVILLAAVPSVQWAAVRMVLLLRMDPPQYGRVLDELTSPTCHGYSFTSVTTPPTILLALLGTPQLHSVAGVVEPAGVDSVVVEADSFVVEADSVVVESDSSVDVASVSGSWHVLPPILLRMNSKFSVTLE